LRPTVKIIFTIFSAGALPLARGILEILKSRMSGGHFDLFAAVLSHKERVVENISLQEWRKSFLHKFFRFLKTACFPEVLWQFFLIAKRSG